MSLLHPTLLWLLLVPAAGLLLLLRAARAAAPVYPKIPQARLRSALGHWSLVIGHSARSPRPIAALLALVLLIVALARPQGGEIAMPGVTEARDVLVAVDVSRSMLADDVAPDRLSRARLLVRSLADELKGERLGLLPFAGTAFLQSPLSADYEIFRTFLDELGPDMIPAGGSDFAALLSAADEAFGPADPTSPEAPPAADRFLVVLSDGEAQDDAWRPVAQKLAERGVRVIALGLGTSAGAMIPDGKGGLVKDPAGAVVLSRLEAGTLRELARLTDGAYRDASTWVDLPALLRETVARGRAARIETESAPRRAELFAWFLAPALALLAFSLLREFPVTPRQAPKRVATPPLPTRYASALAFFLALAVSLPAADQPAAPSDPLLELVGRLASADSLTPADLAALSTLTAEQGEAARARPGSPALPEGAVRDALAATAQGRATAPTAADWDGLRARLESLLASPPESPRPDKSDAKNPPPPPKDPSDPASPPPPDQQGQGEDRQQPPPEDAQSGSPSDSESSPGSPGAPSDQPPSTPPKPSQDSLGELGDDPPTSSPSPSDQPPPEEPPRMQRAGGVSASGRPEGEPTDAATADPALALPKQRLEGVRRSDAPARLYQLLQQAETPPDSERRPGGTPTRDW